MFLTNPSQQDSSKSLIKPLIAFSTVLSKNTQKKAPFSDNNSKNFDKKNSPKKFLTQKTFFKITYEEVRLKDPKKERKRKARKREEEETINKKEGRWTPEEHLKFLRGIVMFGKNWKQIQKFIGTRTSTQARSHAQKFFYKLKQCKDEEIGIDFTLDNVKNLTDMVNQIKSENKEYIVKVLNNLAFLEDTGGSKYKNLVGSQCLILNTNDEEASNTENNIGSKDNDDKIIDNKFNNNNDKKENGEKDKNTELEDAINLEVKMNNNDIDTINNGGKNLNDNNNNENKNEIMNNNEIKEKDKNNNKQNKSQENNQKEIIINNNKKQFIKPVKEKEKTNINQSNELFTSINKECSNELIEPIIDKNFNLDSFNNLSSYPNLFSCVNNTDMNTMINNFFSGNYFYYPNQEYQVLLTGVPFPFIVQQQQKIPELNNNTNSDKNGFINNGFNNINNNVNININNNLFQQQFLESQILDYGLNNLLEDYQKNNKININSPFVPNNRNINNNKKTEETNGELINNNINTMMLSYPFYIPMNINTFGLQTNDFNNKTL